MKNLATLKKMDQAIFKAMSEYLKSVAENLTETGELNILPCDYDEELGYPEGILLSVPNNNFDLVDCVYDKIKVNEQGRIELHICYFGDGADDSWQPISDLSFTDASIVIDAIKWPEQVASGEQEEKKVRVLCYCDTDTDYKGVLLVTAFDADLKQKRQAIDDAIRCAFYDEYDAEAGTPETEEEFEKVLDKLAAGQDADFHEYEIFWDTTVSI